MEAGNQLINLGGANEPLIAACCFIKSLGACNRDPANQVTAANVSSHSLLLAMGQAKEIIMFLTDWKHAKTITEKENRAELHAR